MQWNCNQTTNPQHTYYRTILGAPTRTGFQKRDTKAYEFAIAVPICLLVDPKRLQKIFEGSRGPTPDPPIVGASDFELVISWPGLFGGKPKAYSVRVATTGFGRTPCRRDLLEQVARGYERFFADAEKAAAVSPEASKALLQNREIFPKAPGSPLPVGLALRSVTVDLVVKADVEVLQLGPPQHPWFGHYETTFAFGAPAPERPDLLRDWEFITLGAVHVCLRGRSAEEDACDTNARPLRTIPSTSSPDHSATLAASAARGVPFDVLPNGKHELHTLITSTLPPAPAAAATSVSTAPDTRGTPTPVWEIFGEQEDQEQEDGEYWLDDEEWECYDEYYEEEGGLRSWARSTGRKTEKESQHGLRWTLFWMGYRDSVCNMEKL
ncbi:uncharacterized protein BXZ73DRAFT_81478 [Epithele typhae]|uniref:uncharacterized protein n=1 Tax=Epithele typhae TaxID=378194 RepID=UPI002007893B|nr:uncharacterized protein BXZ73DRAFT_81478 [Epithele typhae]KAH9915050.1 hypothetical protein BXZ73DRAFT_81478 [Epithele typhae]